jgi:hypothetical protein
MKDQKIIVVALDSYEDPLSLIGKHFPLDGNSPLYILEFNEQVVLVSDRPIDEQVPQIF